MIDSVVREGSGAAEYETEACLSMGAGAKEEELESLLVFDATGTASKSLI